jgi:hypothetical protein
VSVEDILTFIYNKLKLIFSYNLYVFLVGIVYFRRIFILETESWCILKNEVNENNKDLHELNKSSYYLDGLHIMLQQV